MKRISFILISVLCIILTLPAFYKAPRLFASEIKSPDIVNPYKYYTYWQMTKDMAELKAKFPKLVNYFSIGKSVEGRDIWVVTLGTGKKKAFLNGSHHARELITSPVLMEMVEQYSLAYTSQTTLGGYNVRKVLDSTTLYIAPMVNPDGVTLVQFGVGAMKDQAAIKKIKLVNLKYGYRSWKANIRGVDLNDNYPIGWSLLHTGYNFPASEKYKGPNPLTEPETKAITAFINKTKDFSIYSAYHTQGERIYWADIGTKNLTAKFLPLAKQLSKSTGYSLVSAAYSDYGAGFAEWTRWTFKKPSFTIEMCPYVGPYPYPYFDTAWNRVKYTGLLLAQEAQKW
jgi:hypothetical protein